MAIFMDIMKFFYDIICYIQILKKKHYLTNFNENNRASVSKSKYQEVLAKLFDFIEQFSQGKIVNLPLIGGSNRAGLDISLQKRLECIILTALFRNQLSLGILNIVLTEKTLKEINLNKIDLIIDAIK